MRHKRLRIITHIRSEVTKTLGTAGLATSPKRSIEVETQKGQYPCF
jgi:hypothetical protein